ncbi:hypothetical protein IQ293_31235 [Streptomyces platensis]|nr:hypothetical protein [Streptomyces platensis]
MTDSERLPLLFLDADGPLIPFGAEPQRYPTYATGLDLWAADANPLSDQDQSGTRSQAGRAAV